MFAIVRLGNQQFKVKAGDFIRAPFQDCSVEDKIEIPVLAFDGEKGFAFGASQLKGCKVKAVVIRQSLGKKVIVFKKKRRKGYRRTRGHRQKITELRILELCSPEGKVSRVEWKGNSAKTSEKAKTPEKTATLGKATTAGKAYDKIKASKKATTPDKTATPDKAATSGKATTPDKATTFNKATTSNKATTADKVSDKTTTSDKATTPDKAIPPSSQSDRPKPTTAKSPHKKTNESVKAQSSSAGKAQVAPAKKKTDSLKKSKK